ncbi:hypothetical protein CERSUDRAFT_112789 [Gelatoporia subvermispora B]|uniref:Thioesterase domain-containing protein n=1 Tax=Ceriporiopsis subvermispora (strain B) TaxID=914234 RepID=M2RJW0_CERS8|nr:hypothetical protein CERSUDRAFT_112789 [Gelatoporia subvermispora B]
MRRAVMLSNATALSLSALRCQAFVGSCSIRSARKPYSGSARSYSSIKALQDAFRDPSSPFHLPPGTQGPASPDPPPDAELLHTSASNTPVGLPEESLSSQDQSAPTGESPLTTKPEPNATPLSMAEKWTLLKPSHPSKSIEERAREHMIKGGFDPDSFWEQKVVWGDHDAFQHVNNVRYVRFFESSRIQWMQALAREIGGPQREAAILRAKGVGLILKSISIDYKAPVTFPDTLLVAHKVHTGTRPTLSWSHFHLSGAIYSYAHKRVVTTCDSILVWYDYDKLQKCDPGKKVREILDRRISRRDRISI